MNDRLPPLPYERLDDAQRAAADELIAGPRKAVKGPFIPLLRSPVLLQRIGKLGEYLRFDSVLPARVNEFATLIVARAWTQQFEWAVHAAAAAKAGTSAASIAALREGRRPDDMDEDEALTHDFCTELLAHHGVSDTSYERMRARFGERGVVELTALVGYFVMVSMVLNVAHTPAEPGGAVEPLPPLPR
ncbi:carboxymuconolactone decarboxylase family protein [Variovorax sp. YR752]|uniref:carboxymuconolactone decarboxylase family protein n=1 Tax=Variovorax sp. YR752 TaxID=1884383 RepID=UPI0031383DBD